MALTREQECIVELYSLLNFIVENAKRRNLKPLTVSSIGGCDQYFGLPPICRKVDELTDRYGDVISEAFINDNHNSVKERNDGILRRLESEE